MTCEMTSPLLIKVIRVSNFYIGSVIKKDVGR
jgi:hypothetical protein